MESKKNRGRSLVKTRAVPDRILGETGQGLATDWAINAEVKFPSWEHNGGRPVVQRGVARCSQCGRCNAMECEFQGGCAWHMTGTTSYRHDLPHGPDHIHTYVRRGRAKTRRMNESHPQFPTPEAKQRAEPPKLPTPRALSPHPPTCVPISSPCTATAAAKVGHGDDGDAALPPNHPVPSARRLFRTTILGGACASRHVSLSAPFSIHTAAAAPTRATVGLSMRWGDVSSEAQLALQVTTGHAASSFGLISVNLRYEQDGNLVGAILNEEEEPIYLGNRAVGDVV
ncbi:hypothetical protein B0I37DRAFT_229184 [Chaetomium sp. MPI-CAGE-AT-0009]|nr:hypothetical protein B0I37DRAFT_229184 [Chaetomium sp. MPI-CAGE-AT-0009]